MRHSSVVDAIHFSTRSRCCYFGQKELTIELYFVELHKRSMLQLVSRRHCVWRWKQLTHIWGCRCWPRLSHTHTWWCFSSCCTLSMDEQPIENSICTWLSSVLDRFLCSSNLCTKQKVLWLRSLSTAPSFCAMLCTQKWISSHGLYRCYTHKFFFVQLDE